MTTFLLIRHGVTAITGSVITGRLPGYPLTPQGQSQAEALADRLATMPINAIYSSPLERTLETAAPAAASLGLAVQPNWAFAEFDFGQWSGVLIEELQQREDWKLFCAFRSGRRAPGGELITETQTRMVDALTDLAGRHPGETVAVFSHADAIKAALLNYLPAPLDHIQRIEIHPTSISVVRLDPTGPVIAGMNLSE